MYNVREMHERITHKRDVQLADLAGPCMVVYNMTNTYPRPPSYLTVQQAASKGKLQLVGSLILAHLVSFMHVVWAQISSIMIV